MSHLYRHLFVLLLMLLGNDILALMSYSFQRRSDGRLFHQPLSTDDAIMLIFM